LDAGRGAGEDGDMPDPDLNIEDEDDLSQHIQRTNSYYDVERNSIFSNRGSQVNRVNEFKKEWK